MKNEPKRHHYIPIFYLKQWARNNGKLCEFSKPYGDTVRPKRVSPAATGYVNGLYEMQGLDGELAQQLERLFLSPVDSRAADILRDMTLNKPGPRDPDRRSQWTRFLLSLLMRMPEEVQAHQKHYNDDWYSYSEKQERDYQKRRKKDGPKTFKEFLEIVDPLLVQRLAMRALVHLMDNESVGVIINGMRWGHLTLPFYAPALLTSDRPMVMSDGLRKPNSFIMMPIGPKQVFFAVNTAEARSNLHRTNSIALAQMINERVVRQAHKYVYSAYDVQLPFVQKHMSREPLPSFMERMREHHHRRVEKIIKHPQ